MRICLLVLLCVIPSDQGVKLLGIFPQHVDDKVNPYHSDHIPLKGNWSRHCLAMFHAAISLADQYNIRLNNERISGDVILINDDETGHAALDYVCQYISSKHPNVVGIVGPGSSNNARFIGPFAAHIKLPVVSYAATNADFSDKQLYPTFYRTVPSDLLLARAIVQLFELFKWKTCTLIVQKNDYGYGGLHILSEYYHQNITIKQRLTFDGKIFNANLKETLVKSLSRIVLVWADEKETTSIIERAFSDGVIGVSYTWITTDEVNLNMLQSTLHEPNQILSPLEGLLTIIPMEVGSGKNDDNSLNINKTLYRDALSAWFNSSDDYEIYPHHDNISPFAMFAFDATWTLIQALNKTSFNGQSSIPSFNSSSYCFNSSLENSILYYKYLDETDLLGISGHISFSKDNSNDRVAGAYYVLRNFQLDKNKHQLKYENIMEWSDKPGDKNGKWQNFTGQHIVWPNRSQNIPPDYPQIRGEKLHIRVIDAPPFVMFWHNSSTIQPKPLNTNYRKTEDTDIEIFGYVADLIDELEKKMGFRSTIDPCPSNMSYNTLVESISVNDTWDIVISDITITSKRLSIVDFSLPICENALRIVVRDSPSFSISFLSYLRPFSLEVWLSVVGTIIYSGLLVYLFEQQTIEETEDYRGPRAVIFGIYQALSSIVGMGGDLQLRTKSSRILIVGLFTMSIILVATYTANLSSFLTSQRSQPIISGIDDIKNGRLPFHRIGILNDSAPVEYYTQKVHPVFYPVKKINDLYTLLLDNRIDAAIENAIGIEYTVDRHYCGRLSVIGVGFAKSSFGIAMAKNWQYKNDLDKTIVSLREEGKLESLEQKWFSERICNSKNHDETWQRDGIPMTVMIGLFASFLAVSVIACALHLYHFRAVLGKSCKEKIGLIAQTATRLIKH